MVTSRLIEQYSASAEERDMKVCFFDFQLMGEKPKLIKKPLTDVRESRQASQSTSQKDKREQLGFELGERP